MTPTRWFQTLPIARDCRVARWWRQSQLGLRNCCSSHSCLNRILRIADGFLPFNRLPEAFFQRDFGSKTKQRLRFAHIRDAAQNVFILLPIDLLVGNKFQAQWLSAVREG